MSMQEFSDNLSTLSYMSRRRIPTWVYDPKNKTLFGRTCCSWSEFDISVSSVLSSLYFVLLDILCLPGNILHLFIMVGIVLQRPREPAGQNRSSEFTRFQARYLLVCNFDLFSKGLGFRPLLNVQKSLIHYSSGDSQTYLPYTQNIDAYLDTYNQVNAKPDSQFASCKGKEGETKDVDKVCKFPLESLGPCNTSNNYGYDSGTPCVLLKVNKVSNNDHLLIWCYYYVFS